MTIALSITMAKLEGCLDLAFLFIIGDLNCLLVQESVTARSYATDLGHPHAEGTGARACELQTSQQNTECKLCKIKRHGHTP